MSIIPNVIIAAVRALSALLLAMLTLTTANIAQAEKRIALVIGNGAYEESPLRNPTNDAADVSQALKGFGFTVTHMENANKRGMEVAINQFSRQLGKDTVGLFYYAGHGLQVKGENYLIPVNAQIESELDAQYNAVNLGRVVNGMRDSGGGLNLVVLDACRNNPYSRSFRSSARGFARTAPRGSGTLIMYATEPGKVAADGEQRNGVFTGELLGALKTEPHLEIERLFKNVSSRVRQKTGRNQTPWAEGIVLGDFSFAAEEPAEPEPAPADDPLVELPAASLEYALWQSAERDDSEASYKAYLEQFPTGVFSGIAAPRLAKKIREREQREAKIAAEKAEQERLAAARAEAERVAEQAEAERIARIESARRAREEQANLEVQQQALMTSARNEERSLRLSRNWKRGIQAALNRAGISVGLEDGLWGNKTRQGIRQWQAQSGLTETGYLSASDYRQLVAELGAEAVAPPRPERKWFEPEMVHIAGGEFEMGSRKGGDDERLVRTVRIDAFEMGKYEVTVQQFSAFVKASGYRTEAERNVGGEGCYVYLPEKKLWERNKKYSWKNAGFSQGENHPVVCVSWNDAQAYVKWLNSETSGNYRLPSESEWEYAARAGSEGKYHYGEDPDGLCEYGNGADRSTLFSWKNKVCNDGYAYTAPVGTYQANGNGLHDVIGNAREWVEDCWHNSYEGAPQGGSAWLSGRDCDRRVLRGGSWFNKPISLRSANRYGNYTTYQNYYSGFRVSRTLTP